MINLTSSFPVFTVTNLHDAREFYQNHFGFTAVFENDWYLHLISESGIQVGFLLPDQPTQPDFFHPLYNGKGVIFSLEVDDAASAYHEALDNSLDIAMDLKSEEWGQIHFVVRDPNGILLDIVEATEPTGEYLEGFYLE